MKVTLSFVFVQIVMEEFLEDINNMLNSGEVPNLFAPDEYEHIIVSTRPSAKEQGINEGDRCVLHQLFRTVQFPCKISTLNLYILFSVQVCILEYAICFQ